MMWGAPLPLVGAVSGPPQLFDLISDDVVSNAATHVVSWDRDYRLVLVSIDHLVPVTNNTLLRVRTSSDGGATFDAGATDYRYELMTVANVQRLLQSALDAYIQIGGLGSNLSNNADFGYHADLVVAQPFDVKRTMLHGQLGYWPNEGIVTMGAVYGLRLAAGRVDALQFFMSAGNISTARIRATGVLAYGEGS